MNLADRAWAIPGLSAVMARQWRRRVEAFASYDMRPGDVVMLGDSITEGANWEALFPLVRVHNHGIGGDDTAGVLRRLALVTDRRPGKVFLMIGTNDIGKGVSSVGEIVDNVAAIVDQIRTDSSTTEVYVQSVLPRLRRRADQVGSVNRGIETVARDGGATWIDLRSIFDRGDGGMNLRLAPDSLHPNAEGYRRWAEFIAPFLADAPPRVPEGSEVRASEAELTSVERVIPAPRERIFVLLADPSRHREIDGSGSVRRAREGSQRLALGTKFVMSMRLGIPYSTVSEVVEFEENRRIAWQTYSTIPWLARWGGGRIWRYELEPVEGGTLVRETWDISHEVNAAKGNLANERTRRYMTTNMEKTLLRIEQVTAPLRPSVSR